MGIVYEALKKSEVQHGPGVGELETDNRTGMSTESENFDFVKYSLNTGMAAELEKSQREAEAARRMREEEAQPCRSVELSVSRIDPHLVQFYDCDPIAADHYNRLAGSLIAASSENGLKRLLVASARHAEGRTSVILNLACALAHANRRVLVVDADFKRPSVLRLLGVESEIGIAELLPRKLSPGKAAVKILPHGFTVLPTRARVENPAEVIASREFRELINDVEPYYDFILFDSSPLLESSDSNLLVGFVNSTLLVIRAGKTSSAQLGRAISPLTAESVFGVVVNRVN